MQTQSHQATLVDQNEQQRLASEILVRIDGDVRMMAPGAPLVVGMALGSNWRHIVSTDRLAAANALSARAFVLALRHDVLAGNVAFALRVVGCLLCWTALK